MTNTEREVYKAIIEVIVARKAVRHAEDVTRDLHDVQAAHARLSSANLWLGSFIPSDAIDEVVAGVLSVIELKPVAVERVIAGAWPF